MQVVCTAPYLINRTVHIRAPPERKKERSISARQKGLFFCVLLNHVCNISDFCLCHFYGGCVMCMHPDEGSHSGTQLAWEQFVNNGYVLYISFGRRK